MSDFNSKVTRISADKTDKGFRVDYFLFDVYLDGRLLDYCITADEEKNEVLCYRKGARGGVFHHVNDDGTTGEPITETRYGRVEIRKAREHDHV